MHDAADKVTPMEPSRKLANAIREVKNALADRDDVVVDLREAHRARLDLLAAELSPVFADVPADMDNFDFAISSGLQPRLWIDAVAHVQMGSDRRTYRFLRDTRAGRIVLAESTDMRVVADHVTRYIAERVVERQRLMEGMAEPLAATFRRQEVLEAGPLQPGPAERRRRYSAILSGVAMVAAGALVGLVVSAILLWDRLVAMQFSF